MRTTTFEHDEFGRLISQSVNVNNQNTPNKTQTDYHYDRAGRLVRLSEANNTALFYYNVLGQLVRQGIWQENGTLEQCAYEFDANGNRTKLTLPNNDEIRYFYYGTGHLSAIKYNDKLITEIKRDARHQEVERTQGELTSYFNLDPLGRLTKQLVENPTSGQILSRNYQYDRTGNLAQVNEQRRGKNSVTHYRYDKLGQLKMAGDEMFSFDPAHNIIEQAEQKITNNQVSDYQGIQYRYDELGNLSERILPNGEVQTYRYNLKDQLIEASIQKPNRSTEVWQYQYDALGRRINKRLKNGGNLQETRFVWDGSHLVQEENESGKYSYIYTHPSSYELLAQLHFTKEGKNSTACNLYYYHTDQIGVPRELTDEQGKICWYGDYSGWGKLKDGYDLTEDKSVHQPFRLQNQYADEETGLHYNFFRYYEPNMGRFTQLDPIGLAGGMNAYQFAPNVQNWVDSWGLRSSQYIQQANSRLPNRYGNNMNVNVNQRVINTTDMRIKKGIPTKMKGKDITLLKSDKTAVSQILTEKASGDLKDWLIDMSGLPERKIEVLNTVNQAQLNRPSMQCKTEEIYECRIRVPAKCGFLQHMSGAECVNEIIENTAKPQYILPPKSTIECKRI